MTDLISPDIYSAAEAHQVKLDQEQIHIGNERAIMSPHKYVLTGVHTPTGSRVVFKCASHPTGVAELVSEQTVLHTLKTVPFTEQVLSAPKQIFYGTHNGLTLVITEFIEQSDVFPNLPLREQFFLALQALEAQESFHATTLSHRAHVRDAFEAHDPSYYLQSTTQFAHTIVDSQPDSADLLGQILEELTSCCDLLTVYDGYLMHTDFVPHNFRLAHGRIYLLDYSSFRLGNKYESWARLVNFMELHSPDLCPLLNQYIESDRGSEEAAVYRLMRIHKALFLVQYYCQAEQKTTGDTKELSSVRIKLWLSIVQHLFEHKPIPRGEIEHYRILRNTLRSETEKARQKEFTVL